MGRRGAGDGGGEEQVMGEAHRGQQGWSEEKGRRERDVGRGE